MLAGADWLADGSASALSHGTRRSGTASCRGSHLGLASPWPARRLLGRLVPHRPVNAVLGWFFRGFNRVFDGITAAYGWRSAGCCA